MAGQLRAAEPEHAAMAVARVRAHGHHARPGRRPLPRRPRRRPHPGPHLHRPVDQPDRRLPRARRSTTTRSSTWPAPTTGTARPPGATSCAAAVTDAPPPGVRPLPRRARRRARCPPPAPTTSPACAGSPTGDDLYRQLIRLHTGLDLTPEELHEIGLHEVTEDLPAQYRALGRRAVRHRRPRPRSSTTSSTTRTCATATATRSSTTPAGASTTPPRPWATGSASCPQAPVRAHPDPRLPRRRRAGGVLHAPGPRRQPARRVPRQPPRAHQPGPRRDGVDRLPRGHPRPPPAARHRQRADRPPGVPPPVVGPHRLRRGLGALHRAAGRGDGPLPDRHRPPRHAGQRLVAGLPAGGRHRPARHGLDPPAGHRLHGRARARSARTRSSPRSTATSACPARPSPTRSASGRSSRLRAEAEARLGDRFSLPGFHDVVLVRRHRQPRACSPSASTPGPARDPPAGSWPHRRCAAAGARSARSACGAGPAGGTAGAARRSRPSGPPACWSSATP